MSKQIEVAELKESETVDKPKGFVFNSSEGKGYGVVTADGVIYFSHFGQAWKLGKQIKKG